MHGNEGARGSIRSEDTHSNKLDLVNVFRKSSKPILGSMGDASCTSKKSPRTMGDNIIHGLDPCPHEHGRVSDGC